MRPKTILSCCGYQAAMGSPGTWECPSCGVIQIVPGEDWGPEEYVPVPPGASSSLPSALGNLPGLR